MACRMPSARYLMPTQRVHCTHEVSTHPRTWPMAHHAPRGVDQMDPCRDSKLEASGVPTPSGIRIRMRRRRLPRPTFDVFDIRNGGAEVSTRARHVSAAWANVYLRIAGRPIRLSLVLTSRARGHSHSATPTRRAEPRSVTSVHAPRRSLSRRSERAGTQTLG